MKELRREKIYAAYKEAAGDEACMEEMRDVTEAFNVADRDGLS